MPDTIITEKKIETEEERINLFLNSEKLNFASKGIFYVDREHPKFYEFIEAALWCAKIFQAKEEVERLSKILENKPQ